LYASQFLRFFLAMPRYFFDIVDDAGVTRDPEGSELSSPAAAMEEARATAREMLADSLRAGRTVDGRRFDITNESGQVIGTFRFRDLLA
jgi:hypothetical protein